jgi:hypothetical protein
MMMPLLSSVLTEVYWLNRKADFRFKKSFEENFRALFSSLQPYQLCAQSTRTRRVSPKILVFCGFHGSPHLAAILAFFRKPFCRNAFAG